MPVRELEGTWEEILAHASELAGRRLRVTVLPSPDADTEGEVAGMSEDPRLAVLRRIDAITRDMRPKPDLRDYLREGRAGGMFGYEPAGTDQ